MQAINLASAATSSRLAKGSSSGNPNLQDQDLKSKITQFGRCFWQKKIDDLEGARARLSQALKKADAEIQEADKKRETDEEAALSKYNVMMAEAQNVRGNELKRANAMHDSQIKKIQGEREAHKRKLDESDGELRSLRQRLDTVNR